MDIYDISLVYIAKVLLDVALVSYLVYKLINVVKGTKAMQLLKGLFVFFIVWAISNRLDLSMMKWLSNQMIFWGVLVIIILFQPEMRRALEQIGRGKMIKTVTRADRKNIEDMIRSVVDACEELSENKTGALIVFERDTGLDDRAETGVEIDSLVSRELLINIFSINTPLHDGAVIISKDRLKSASCYLPLTEDVLRAQDLGARHRASLGISEETDSVSVVVSEETGNISIAQSGKLYSDINKDQLRVKLTEELLVKEKKK